MLNYTLLDCLRALQISQPHSWLRVDEEFFFCIDPYSRANAQTENVWGYESLLQTLSIYGGNLLSRGARADFPGTVFAGRGEAVMVAEIRLVEGDILFATVWSGSPVSGSIG